MSESSGGSNIDRKTVEGFGEEWNSFDQQVLLGNEYAGIFESYFGIFPFDNLPARSEGFDLGCGSGRWAAGVIDRVGVLNCIDPSEKALAVARRRLDGKPNARFHCASVDAMPLADASQDFGISLGVLHHVPDTAAALRDCARKLKPGAPMLVYLYYAFDNRPGWFRALWKASDLGRCIICRFPFGLRKFVTDVIAALVYWPLARTAGMLEKLGANIAAFPLSTYRNYSFYSMRTDALDRFGTRLEKRFTRAQVAAMMADAGLTNIRFSEQVPHWTAVGLRCK